MAQRDNNFERIAAGAMAWAHEGVSADDVSGVEVSKRAIRESQRTGEDLPFTQEVPVGGGQGGDVHITPGAK